MELIDILDKEGNKTGQTKNKDLAHRDGDWHRVVHVWIINSNQELLIQLRAPNKVNYPGHWDVSAAGHLATSENSAEAAVREIKEELGIDIDKNKLEHLGTVINKRILNRGNYLDNSFADIFLITMDLNPSTLKFEDNEVMKAKFVPFKELEKIINSGKEKFVPQPDEYPLLFKELYKRFG